MDKRPLSPLEEDRMAYRPDRDDLGGSGPVRELPRFERRSRPRRRLGWLKVFLALLLLIVLAVVLYVGILIKTVVGISTNPLDFSVLSTDIQGRTNILVLGLGDPGHAGEQLTDTMMVVSLDTRGKRVAQVSLPRDLRVQIPGEGSHKINTAHALGGPQLAAQTVSNTLGIPIHYYVKTNFSGLRNMVDGVGGIEVEVKDRLADPEYPCSDNQYKACGLLIEPGLQHMDGERALQYARCRKGTCGNDFGRAARQQEVVTLVLQKMIQWAVLLNPVRLSGLSAIVRESLETNLSSVQMVQLAQNWKEAQERGDIIRLVLHSGQGGYLRGLPGSSDLVPVGGSFSEIQERVKNIFDEPVRETDIPDA